jgi:type II secretory pathway pseudopilin PulG
MRSFSKQETFALGIILLLIAILSIYNFSLALRRARDAQRKVDLGTLYNALNKYQQDYGFYPPSSENGKIIACKGENFENVIKDLKDDAELDLEKYFSGLRGCKWGEDSFADVLDVSHTDYISTFPRDPKVDLGYRYYYISNNRRFQIYAYLEGEGSEVGYSGLIIDRNIDCGGKTCNFGRASGSTPLEKSLKEYENELLQESTKI